MGASTPTLSYNSPPMSSCDAYDTPTGAIFEVASFGGHGLAIFEVERIFTSLTIKDL